MTLQRIRKISLGIVQDPAINSGRPIIEGTRIFVDRIIGHLESGQQRKFPKNTTCNVSRWNG